MSPITHGLLSWIVADLLLKPAGPTLPMSDIPKRTRQRDLLGISLAGVLADIDGIGILVDSYNSLMGHPATDYYTCGHHVVLHGIFGCLVMAAVAWLVSSTRSIQIFVLGLASAHLHLLCDLLGSRGAGSDEIWPIVYGGPWSRWGEFQWSGQWRLDSWQNVCITIACLAWCFYKTWKRECSPLELISSKAHEALYSTLISRFGEPQQFKGLEKDRGSKRGAENEQP